MIYITQADILQHIDADSLQVLTGGDNTVLERAETEAKDEIFAYLNVRYNAPEIFNPDNELPAIVKLRLIDIMLYHLHAKVSPDHIPELRNQRYQDAVNWLEKIADGFINPDFPVKDTKDATPLRFGSGKKFNHYY